jgi:hypothetical protein
MMTLSSEFASTRAASTGSSDSPRQVVYLEDEDGNEYPARRRGLRASTGGKA